MTPRQTAETYDKIASFWSGEEFNRANGIAQHRRALHFVTMGKEGSSRQALDVGCGSSGRMVELLLAEGFEVEGMDVSAEMLRLARARHPGVTFHLADICTWELPQRYDFISAWDSLWHAPLAEHEGILHKLCGGLNPGGVLIFTSGGLDASEERCHELMGEPVYHATLGLPRILELVAGAGCVCRHLEYDQHPELHVYLIVQKSGGEGDGPANRLAAAHA
ncbi:class I SAM-dependent methyltransferase [Prosthecobacter sp. SYSU 5D2]|uniref:class I SAM-dependent methyltransferase n=1 Tax=Prosthecobacter sp. SYSU 5D2 TaxID=3134134 RepID=UPI0031FF2E02